MQPSFHGLNHSIKWARSQQLPALNDWPPSPDELKAHNKRVAKGALPPTAVCKPDWPVRMQAIHNCLFVLAKYKQFVYWITTKTLRDGARVAAYSPRGICPFCHIPTGTDHMLKTCPLAHQIWTASNALGHRAWGKYTDFKMDEVPYLLQGYSPPALWKLSVLWALWTTWCTHMFDQDPQPPPVLDEWYDKVLEKARSEITARLYEAAPVIAWLGIAGKRRAHSRDTQAKEGRRVTEKEFLLIHAQHIQANPESIKPLAADEDSDPLFNAWAGNNTLITIKTPTPEISKLKIDHTQWPQYRSALGRPPDPPCNILDLDSYNYIIIITL